MQANYSNLIELFISIVRKHPDRVALKDHKSSCTYLQLYHYAVQVAEVLLGNDIQPGYRIICISKKDTESIICFWGILFSGGIPVMLDHEDGIKANVVKIKEVKPHAILLDKSNLQLLPEVSTVLLFDFQEIVKKAPLSGEISLPSVTIPNVCYILTTSGTTGNPKAVQISHENVLHYTTSIFTKIGAPEKVNAVHASTFAADLGLTNLLVALISGGMLRILNKTEATDPVIFNEIIDRDEISLLKITPSHLLSLVSNMQKPYKHPINTIVLGGEKLSWETVSFIFALGLCRNLFNHYGPTEATIGAVAFKIEPSSEHFNKTGSVPLGSPLGQGNCFLENARDDVGELYITGPGVSVGYLDNEVENNKKFSIKEEKDKPVLCYRTGDICRKLKDGNYEFLYRTDRQVKVKGYRVELGEIEIALAGHPDIENVAVTVFDNQGHTILDAYIKPYKDRQLTAPAIRTWLNERLPAYKVPSNFYFYTQTPYNSNGKIDMSALKKHFKSEVLAHAPVTAAVHGDSWAALVEASWKKLLNKIHIESTDNFYEIGGDSLLAIQLLGKLQRYGYKVHIIDLNNHPIYADFIALEPEKASEVKRSAGNGRRNKLTFSQYCFLQQQQFNLDEYCQTLLLETGASIHIREMALALNYVLDSHLQLNTSFSKTSHGYALKEKKQWGLELKTTVLGNKTPIVDQIQEGGHQLLKALSIEAGKLFVAHVFVDLQGKDYLFLACHHLAVDVVSWHIIIDELLEYYDQLRQGQVPVVVPENSVQQFYEQATNLPAQKQQLLINEKIYRLPQTDTNETTIAVFSIQAPAEMSAELLKLEEQKQISTINNYLLYGFADALLEAFSLNDITIDVEFHGRPQQPGLPDLSRSVGWWATTLPVNFTKDGLDVKTASNLMEEKTRIANNLNIYYDQVIEQLTEKADVRFNYLGRFPGRFENASIQMQPAGFNPGSTRSIPAQQEYLLYFTARFIGACLIIDVQYHVKKLAPELVEEMLSNFMALLARHFKTGHYSMPAFTYESNIPSVGQPLFNLSGNGTVKAINNRKILLTGATGFLGIHLLHELMKYEAVTLYCLVRGSNATNAEERLQDCIHYYFGDVQTAYLPKINIIQGDLLQQYMGVGKAAYEQLANELDLVLHAAADINLLKEFEGLAQTNIAATKHIIELAKTGKKKALHFISTLAVSGYTNDHRYMNFSEDDFEHDQYFMSDYERTKFEAEKLVRKFLNEGHEGKIYRVGHIAADSINARFQRNIEQNRIFQIIKGIMTLQKIPDVYNEGIAFSYVDIVAKGIVGVCMNKIESSMQCFHLENSCSFTFTEIAAMLNQLGYDIDFVDLYTFTQGVDEFEGKQQEKNTVLLTNNWIQRFMNYPRQVHYINRNSIDTIAKAGLYFPKTSFEWFAAMITAGIHAGYFHFPASQKADHPTLAGVVIA